MRIRTSLLVAALMAIVLLLACATPDPVITTKIRAKMAADEAVRSASIEVHTSEGVVTLTGNIDSQEAKDHALRLAKETAGVVDVVDMISVKTAEYRGNAPEPERTVGEHVDDAALTVRVKTTLLDDPIVRGLNIDVDTRDGVVFLTGSVRSEDEKKKAVELARNTKGVRDVQVNLSISSR